jgi:hypothetical protein
MNTGDPPSWLLVAGHYPVYSDGELGIVNYSLFTLLLYYSVAVWLCGCVAVWLCGCVAV